MPDSETKEELETKRVLGVVDLLAGRERRQVQPRDYRCHAELDGHRCELPKGHEHGHRAEWRVWGR